MKEHPRRWDTYLGQAEFAYNSMTNRSTGRCPFSIVYSKIPNHAVDVAILPQCNSEPAKNLAEDMAQMLQEVRRKLEEANLQYKQDADVHRRQKLFTPGDLVMVRLRKERFSPGTYSKLSPRKLGPFPIRAKINDNAYVIDLPPDILTSSTFNVTDIYAYHPPDETDKPATSLESSFSEAGED